MTTPAGRQAHDPWAPHTPRGRGERGAAPPGEGTGPAAGPIPVADAGGPQDVSKLKKPELQDLAERMGLDTSGTRDDLIDRITGASGQR